MIDWSVWEPRFDRFLTEAAAVDAAHDRAHIQRVLGNARKLAASEGAALEVVVPAGEDGLVEAAAEGGEVVVADDVEAHPLHIGAHHLAIFGMNGGG